MVSEVHESDNNLVPSGGGDTGGVVHRSSRAALLYLQREVERGADLSDAEAEANVLFAVTARDDPRADHRTKLRAVELLESMRSRGINVAMHLDKMGRPTMVQHEHDVVFRVVIE